MSLLEAQAAGVPVVASRYDGYKDLVEDGVDGFLVDTWQPSVDALGDWFDVMDATAAQLLQAQSTVVDLPALADRLVRLLTDGDMRRSMGEEGRRKVDRRYRWSRIIAHYESLWDDLARDAAGIAPGPARENPFALGPSRTFSHYTSHTLSSSTLVVATSAVLDEFPYSETGGWLTSRALRALIELAATPVTAGDLVGAARLPASHGWFAVAWLLKYGLLRHADVRREPPPHVGRTAADS